MIETLGGRKFILSIFAMIALITLSALKPGALTVELITGMLGIIAAFNVANVVLTPKGPVELPTTTPPLEPTLTAPLYDDSVAEGLTTVLNRVAHLEKLSETQHNNMNTLADMMITATSLTKPNGQGKVESEAQPAETVTTNANQNREEISRYLQSIDKQNRG